MATSLSPTSKDSKAPPSYMGLSLCCYAQLLPYANHFSCSDCSTLYNKVPFTDCLCVRVSFNLAFAYHREVR